MSAGNKVKTISYKRVKNLGNYQSETLEVSVELNSMDDPEEQLKELKAFVENSLFPPLPSDPGPEDLF